MPRSKQQLLVLVVVGVVSSVYFLLGYEHSSRRGFEEELHALDDAGETSRRTSMLEMVWERLRGRAPSWRWRGSGFEEELHDLDDTGEARLEERFLSRRQRMRDTCLERENDEDVIYSVETRILYFWDYNVSVCLMPKIASETWRTHARLLNRMGESADPGSDPRREQFLKTPWKAIMNYTKATSKWLTVRHPLARLVSCYQDRYLETRKNREEEFLLPALYSNGYIEKSELNSPLSRLKKSKKVPSSVTFPEFINHVVRSYEGGYVNKHWRTYGLLCSPCYFDFDYVARLETLDEDLEYLFDKYRLPSNPTKHVKHARIDIAEKLNKDLKYYEKVPIDLKRKVYEIFKNDIEMFGYDIPDDFWATS